MSRKGYRYRISYREGTTYQRAGRTLIPKNKAITGQWNFIDDRTGFKLKSSQADLTWDGFLVANDNYEPRTPQDFVRAVKDQKPLPSSMIRQEITPPQFGSITEQELINELLLRK